jgi:hypothetical protein
MKLQRVALASALLVFFAAPASGMNGAYRLVTGTLVWPNELPGQPRAVIRGDDGVNYVAELAPRISALGTDVPRPRAGDRVTVLGRDGFQDGQLLEAAVEPISPTVASLVPPPATGTAGSSTAPSQDLGRMAVSGSIRSIGPSTVTVLTPDGRSVTVDVSRLSAEIRSDLRTGDSVMLYVPERIQGTPIAEGIVVDRGGVYTLPRMPR